MPRPLCADTEPISTQRPVIFVAKFVRPKRSCGRRRARERRPAGHRRPFATLNLSNGSRTLGNEPPGQTRCSKNKRHARATAAAPRFYHRYAAGSHQRWIKASADGERAVARFSPFRSSLVHSWPGVPRVCGTQGIMGGKEREHLIRGALTAYLPPRFPQDSAPRRARR